MKEENEWKEAESGEVIKLEPGERVEGKYLGYEESKKYPDSYAMTLLIGDEQKVLFINEILKNKIDKNSIMVNQEIAVLFAGKVKNQAGTHEYNDFKLFFK